MRLAAAVLLLSLLAAGARAQDISAPDMQPGQAVDDGSQTNEQLNQLAQRIKDDPAVASSLAQRIAQSSIARQISPSGDVDQLAQWAQQNPDAAARLAVGFAQDDASGNHLFEDSLVNQSRQLGFNPNSRKGIMGRLDKAAKDSGLMGKDATMSDEERNEILKTMFEGKGSESGKIITVNAKPGQEESKGAAGVPSNYFDRLSQGNLHGYSPQLQALQSTLNQENVPGAPKLIETGRLDYPTLSYPAYGMRYDVGNLDARLRFSRAEALVKALGESSEFSPAQLADPNVQAELESKAAARGIKLSGHFEARHAALDRAAAALKDFDAAALPAKDPLRITRALILGLGDRQKEAARWITVASLEEELDRLDAEGTLLSPELLDMIAHCPVGEEDKAGYRKRGQLYEADVARIKSNDEGAVAALQSDAWQAQMASVETALRENAELRRGLSLHMADFRAVPYYLLQLVTQKPRWREILDGYVKEFLPQTAYGRQLLGEDARREKLKGVFSRIAMGDLDAAHTILAAEVPSGGPPSQR